jgi:hypothetical protein
MAGELSSDGRVLPRHHQTRDDQGGRGTHDRGEQDVAGRARQHRFEEARIKRHDRTGDGCHAGGHDGEQAAFVQPGKPGTDEDGGFNHADEDVGGRSSADRPADAHGALQC